MLKRKDLRHGELVKFKNRIMMVYTFEALDKTLVGLVDDNNKYRTNDIQDLTELDYKYYPIKDIKKLKPVKVDEKTIREFFTLKKDYLYLAKHNKYPFSNNSKRMILKEKDIETLLNNLDGVNEYTYDAWRDTFIKGNIIKTNKCLSKVMDIDFLWKILQSELKIFDPTEDESKYLLDLFNMYKKNKNKRIEEINIRGWMNNAIINLVEEYSKDNIVFEELKKMYIKSLNKALTSKYYYWANKATYTYYEGNNIIPGDFKKAEKGLLLMAKRGDTFAHNSLGYIYYSNRLGKPDYDKAYYHFSIAAKKQITEAEYKLADMIRKGHGTKKNPKKAFKILKDVYERQLVNYQEGYYICKLADVALRMGYCYENGEGVKKDRAQAKDYYLQAKEAIKKRKRFNYIGDEYVKRRIDESLKRINNI